MKNKPKGIKHDQNKLRYELLPPEPIEELVKILTHGAVKYEDHNWKYVEPFEDRYYGASMRHIQAWRKGEVIDPESGFHHLGSVLCNILFLLHRDLENETEEDMKQREILQKQVIEEFLNAKK